MPSQAQAGSAASAERAETAETLPTHHAEPQGTRLQRLVRDPTSSTDDGDTSTPRRRSTAAEFIATELRTDILLARLTAGTLLPQEELAKRYGTSIIPVREALRSLEAEGHVELRPHRTAQV